ncbi:MAG: DivIVA domain-containing protein, partial [Gaiellaceae bacterium]
PVEIRHIAFARRLFGYKPSAVEGTLTEVAESFEEVWRERADLADKLEQLELDISRYREMESLLHTTLVSAERAAADMKEQARRDADTILAEAHNEARGIALEAHEQHARLVADTRRLKALLESALAAVSDADVEAQPAREEEPKEPVPDGDDPWQDTGTWAA